MANAQPSQRTNTDRRHHRIPVIDRVLRSCVEDANGCWLWQRSLTRGYGRITLGGQGSPTVQTHRVTYEYFRGEIPPGLALDHLCRRRNCTNPWHLDPTTAPENVRRGDTAASGTANRSKTHCRHGHALTPENIYRGAHRPTERACRTCKRDRTNRSKQRARAKGATAR
jgi:hypothetical protein